MFRHILVALDSAPLSAAALPLVRTLAVATQAAVTLVRVVPGASHRAETDPQATEAASYLRGVADELGRSQLLVRTSVRMGDPVSEILAERKEQGADLVVLTTHGRSGIARAVHGSVTDGILATAPVPLVVLRHGERRVTQIKTLLVPVDGSPGGAVALGTALGLAKATSARLVLVQVTVPIPLWVYGDDLQGYVDPVWDEDAQASAQHYVDSLVQRLNATGLQAEGGAPMGEVASSIVREAERVEADLIVMSTHALVGPARTLVGSVADQVLRTAGRPVVLVRRTATPSDAKAGTGDPSRTAEEEPADAGGVQVDEDTGEAAGIGGVVGAALGAVTGGPIGAALGAAGGMAVGAGAEMAMAASGHRRDEHEHHWDNDVCTRCGAPRHDAAAGEPSQR